ncbi:hypothetical protein P4200_34965 [Pseudomonas aeruginosa]|nr:hypothetical protein [Pseudomonas aeruginosa]
MSSEHDGKDQDDLFSPLPYLLVSGAVVPHDPAAALPCSARASSSDRPDRDDSATAAEGKSITRRFIGAAHSSGSQWPQPGRTWPSTSSA